MKVEKIVAGMAFLVSAGCFWACDNEEIRGADEWNNPASGIVAIGVADGTGTRAGNPDDLPVLFTDENIATFNSVTREIRFKGIEPAKTLTPYKEIIFQLNGETLFTASTIISDVNSQIYNDLVLYVANQNYYRYYLNDSYPTWEADSLEAKANAAKREVGWNKFLDHLRDDYRLIEYDDSDPGIGIPIIKDPQYPSLPDSLHNMGDIVLIPFAQKDDWRWTNLEENKLNLIRNEAELKKILTESSYSASGIDFEVHSLLLVRVYVSSGIQAISCGLTESGANAYTYSMKVYLNAATVMGEGISAVLVPAIPSGRTVAFNFETTGDCFEE